MALTAKKEEIFHLLEDLPAEVLSVLLKNPSLDEKHILQLLKRRDLPEDFLRALYNSPLVEQSHPLKVAIVHHAMTPAPLILALLPHLFLFELVTICYLPGATPDQKLSAERAIIQRLSSIPLGNKITLARRATSAVVEAILQEGEQPLISPCLDNPRLKEASIFKFLNGPKATAETISIVARHQKWKGHPNLRLAVLKNSRTPMVWFTLFLPLVSAGEMQSLLASQRLSQAQRRAVREEARHRGLRL